LYELKSNFEKAIYYYTRALEKTHNLAKRAPRLNLRNSIEEIEMALNELKSKINN